MYPADPKSRGFSLTELMVSVVIGLFVLGAVVTVLVSSRKNYTVQDSLARLQENARFAIEFLARDLRMAGYYGCADSAVPVYNQLTRTASSLWNTGEGSGSAYVSYRMEGMEGETATWYPSSTTAPSDMVAGSDALTVRFAASDGRVKMNSATPMAQELAPLALATTPAITLQKGDIVVISDCTRADIVQITADPTGGTLNHATGAVTPGNAQATLSKTYVKLSSTDPEVYVARLAAARYYIATGANGNPALFRQVLTVKTTGGATTATTDAQELVEGIENMQILYGVDTDGDRAPNVYVTADKVGLLFTDGLGWDNVVSVRIGLLAYSIATPGDFPPNSTSVQYGSTVDSGPWDVNGTILQASDNTLASMRVKRRVFVTTVALRNTK